MLCNSFINSGGHMYAIEVIPDTNAVNIDSNVVVPNTSVEFVADCMLPNFANAVDTDIDVADNTGVELVVGCSVLVFNNAVEIDPEVVDGVEVEPPVVPCEVEPPEVTCADALSHSVDLRAFSLDNHTVIHFGESSGNVSIDECAKVHSSQS
ncbi:hypothetical protein Dimus_001256 [Dionaea muscipula]